MINESVLSESVKGRYAPTPLRYPGDNGVLIPCPYDDTAWLRLERGEVELLLGLLVGKPR